jgi:hypothetical protein
MSNAALMIGSAFTAFGPIVALFAVVVFSKAQLVILVTTAAFFYLLSAVFSAIVWKAFDAMGMGGVTAVILPSILLQFFFRCGFVSMYHKVEKVIQESIAKHEQDAPTPEDDVGTIPESTDTVVATRRENNNNNTTSWTETAKLHLELNDASAAIAAATGFAGMNAFLGYGTLLASETHNNRGVLFQESCPGIPTVMVSALLAAEFSILQVFWMLFTFFGVRRRMMFTRGQHREDGTSRAGAWLGDSRNGGNFALLIVLITHATASFLTAFDSHPQGCRVTLPAVGGVVLVTAYLFWGGCGRIYMPPSNNNNSLARRHHMD